jgi:hypothetical protein
MYHAGDPRPRPLNSTGGVLAEAEVGMHGREEGWTTRSLDAFDLQLSETKRELITLYKETAQLLKEGIEERKDEQMMISPSLRNQNS